jgi:hypothetical protein
VAADRAIAAVDLAVTAVEEALDHLRADAEQRMGIPAGDMAVLDDPAYAAALNAWGQFRNAGEAVRAALTTDL